MSESGDSTIEIDLDAIQNYFCSSPSCWEDEDPVLYETCDRNTLLDTNYYSIAESTSLSTKITIHGSALREQLPSHINTQSYCLCWKKAGGADYDECAKESNIWIEKGCQHAMSTIGTLNIYFEGTVLSETSEEYDFGNAHA